VALNLTFQRQNKPKLIATVSIRDLLALPAVTRCAARASQALISQVSSNVNAVETLKCSAPDLLALIYQVNTVVSVTEVMILRTCAVFPHPLASHREKQIVFMYCSVRLKCSR
jgi:hypothetical protein